MAESKPHPQMINTTEALAKLCVQLANERYVTVDTEFIREKTYFPKLCLVQIAGKEGGFAVDPLAKGIELAPFFELLASEKVLKVFHASRQDIEIFFQLTGKVPTPIFDTQIAAMVCGYGESVGYEPLVAKLVGAQIDKSSRFTDWAHRPLSEKQMNYAISDVTHLRPVYEKLVEQIKAADRMKWIKEEMASLYDTAKYEPNPDEVWKKLKYRSRSPKFLATLREVAKWRELEARKSDVPRQRLVKDDTLVEVAAAAPKTPEELQKVRGIGTHLSTRKIKTLLDAIEFARSLPPEEYPKVEHRKPLPAGSDALVELLKALLKIKCDEQGVAQKLVAGKEDLEDMVAGKSEEIPALHGWRYQVFGQYAEALLKGKIAIAKDPKSNNITLKEI